MLFLLKQLFKKKSVQGMQVCLFVCFPEPLQVRYPTQNVKIPTLYHNFLIDYCRDSSLILHIYSRLPVPSLVRVSGLDLSQLFFVNFSNNFH